MGAKVNSNAVQTRLGNSEEGGKIKSFAVYTICGDVNEMTWYRFNEGESQHIRPRSQLLHRAADAMGDYEGAMLCSGMEMRVPS